MAWNEGNTVSSGSFGAVLQRAQSTRLLLLGVGELRTPAIGLRSDGPCAVLTLDEKGMTLEAQGEGRVAVVEANDRFRSWEVSSSMPLNVTVA